MIRRVRLFAAVAALVGAPAAAQTSAVRDSAGIRIVENPARAEAPVVFRLGSRPVVDLGGQKSDVEDEFDPRAPLYAVRRSDGSFAVADAARVIFLTPQGKRLRVTGGPGDGPGEFRFINSICLTKGDTVVVASGPRLSLLDRTGAIVKTVAVPSGGVVGASSCLDDATLLVQFPSVAPGQPTRVRVTRIRTDGSTVGSVGDFAFAPFDMVTTVPPSFTAADQRIYVGGGEATEIEVLTPDGRLLEIVRSADRPTRISAERQDEALRALIPRNAPDFEARLARLRSLPHRDVLPGYRRVLVDPLGTMWVEDYSDPGGEEDGWTAFDAAGRLIGRLVLPSSFSIGDLQAFLSDGALFRRMDNFGFAHLLVYPIERIPAPN